MGERAIVKVSLTAPESVAPGENIPLRVIMASSKVGHDFPTGPLDIIQSWLEVSVIDDTGRTIFTSGQRDAKNFIQPGTFLFKAEPVDQHGNLIDRHNLWEMVGVRYRRALFPGYSDTVQYSVPCSGAVAVAADVSSAVEPGVPPGGRNAATVTGREDPTLFPRGKMPPSTAGGTPVAAVRETPAATTREVLAPPVPAPAQAGRYHVTVALQYRKVDQFLLNYLFGETNQFTSPVTEIARATATVVVMPKHEADIDTGAGPNAELSKVEAR
ncbi:MAG: hypothetical protein L0Z50_38355 [Verrucomicrobiales bacterium]|nr:hypothetical protein [Verrucomicrobiales bacterium]